MLSDYVYGLFLVLSHVLVFMSFILKFGYGSCLCLASLALMSLCYWFPYSLCHVLIGLFMSRDPLCLL